MQCVPKCGDCCGIVPASDSELGAIRRYVLKHDVKPLDQGVICPFFQSGSCAVYPVRPRICQAFGHDVGLRCPHGRNANVRDPAALRRWIMEPGKARSTLHDAFLGAGATEKALGPDLSEIFHSATGSGRAPL